MQHEFHACTIVLLCENIEKLREYVKRNESIANICIYYKGGMTIGTFSL
jgi:hypothetical protein